MSEANEKNLVRLNQITDGGKVFIEMTADKELLDHFCDPIYENESYYSCFDESSLKTEILLSSNSFSRLCGLLFEANPGYTKVLDTVSQFKQGQVERKRLIAEARKLNEAKE